MLRISLIFCFLILNGCSWFQNKKGASDLKKVCQIASRIEAENIQDPAVKATSFAEAVEKELVFGDVKTMMQAIHNADSLRKWELIQMGATELGVKNYECPSLEGFFKSGIQPQEVESLSTESPVYQEMNK